MKGVIVSKVKKFISGELAGWQIPELIWLFGCIAAVGAISLLLGDGILSIIASVTGITYTVLAGKGKISCYLFGAVNTVLYGYVSMQNRLWGEVILNWGWYFPVSVTAEYPAISVNFSPNSTNSVLSGRLPIILPTARFLKS